MTSSILDGWSVELNLVLTFDFWSTRNHFKSLQGKCEELNVYAPALLISWYVFVENRQNEIRSLLLENFNS